MKTYGGYYNYGNVAHKIEEQPDIRRLKRIVKNESVGYRYRWIIRTSAIFLMGFILVAQHSSISMKQLEVLKLQNTVKALQTEVYEKKIELLNEIDYNKIEEKARVKLGMTNPEPYQIVQVNIPKTSYTVQIK